MLKQTVLITGSNKGLGKFLALKFSDEGFNVIINGRDKESLDLVKKQIEKRTDCYSILGDLTSSKTIEDLSALAKSKNIDVLVNNAGIYLNKSIENMTIQEYQNIMDVNFFAPVKLIKSILPIFKEKGSGLIVNINSIAGKQSSRNESAYCATKHALRGFTNSIKPEVIKYARIIDVYSGAMATSMTKGIRQDYDLLIDPAEAAEIIVKNCVPYKTLCPKEIDLGRINY
ncbi:L-rhamnose 1-dehydrogenase (NADP(+)) [uncultured archaeon]|nr:L-rhamnose 1-dehydrogenase (NADP(+)) [uncultured archaeon]